MSLQFISKMPDNNFISEKLLDYIEGLYSDTIKCCAGGIASISPIQLTEELLTLAQFIILSKPSMSVIKILHKAIDIDKESYIESIFHSWRNAENIYFWDIKRSLCWAMSGLNRTIYLTPEFFNRSFMDQAITLVHEIQHLIQRYETLTYSPLNLIKEGTLRNFVNASNNGIPLEAGNFYWALLLGKIGVTAEGLLRRTDGRSEICEFWHSLKEEYPILDLGAITGNDVDSYSDIPFSFKRTCRKKMIYRF